MAAPRWIYLQSARVRSGGVARGFGKIAGKPVAGNRYDQTLTVSFIQIIPLMLLTLVISLVLVSYYQPNLIYPGHLHESNLKAHKYSPAHDQGNALLCEQEYPK